MLFIARYRECRYYLFLKNYLASEGAVSHGVVYLQQLSIARYQVAILNIVLIGYLPNVSSAFKNVLSDITIRLVGNLVYLCMGSFAAMDNSPQVDVLNEFR